MNQINEIKDKWIRIALAQSYPGNDKNLYRYLRDGGLNHLQANYVMSLRENK